jgi:hypothetical protein
MVALHPSAGWSAPTVVIAGAEVQTIDLVTSRARLVGQTRRGKKALPAQLGLSSEDGRFILFAHSDATGRFEFPQVPKGRYKLRAARAVHRGTGRPLVGELDVRDGETAVRLVELPIGVTVRVKPEAGNRKLDEVTYHLARGEFRATPSDSAPPTSSRSSRRGIEQSVTGLRVPRRIPEEFHVSVRAMTSGSAELRL